MPYTIDENLYNPGDYTTQYVGFSLPFSFGAPEESMNEDTIDSITDNLENLINTEPGERVFHPNLGVSFRKFLFEQFDEDIDTFEMVVREDIENQVKRWMPFLQIDEVEVGSNPDTNTYNIRVKFHMRKNPAIFNSLEVNIASGVQ